MARKLFCYVDESGQDTHGELFIVSVIISEQEKEQFRQVCEDIERESHKGQRKWTKTAYDRRRDYIWRVLNTPIFAGKLNFAIYRGSLDYSALTVQTIVLALAATGEVDYKATVLIDGLPRSLEQVVGRQLRQQGVNAKKVRGGKKDENDALIRLADAVCGLVRGAVEGQPAMRAFFEQGLRVGVLRELPGK